MVKCRFLPHGTYTVFPAGFATIAWLFSVTQDGCDYAKLEGDVVQDWTNNQVIPFVEVGFIGYRIPAYSAEDEKWRPVHAGACSTWDDDDGILLDTYWSTAQLFAFIALVLGGSGALFIWFSTCFVFSPGTWRWAGYQLMLAAITQCLAFLWFGTGVCELNKCELFWGSMADILAALLWLIASCLMIRRYPSVISRTVDTFRREDADSPHREEDGNLPLEGDATARLTEANPPSERRKRFSRFGHSTENDSNTTEATLQMKEAEAELI